jgi:hypothetical protein
VYPYYLSFPEALHYDDRYLYAKGDVKDAARKILYHIDEPMIPDVSCFYKPFDESVKRMLHVMKGDDSAYMNLFTKQEGDL